MDFLKGLGWCLGIYFSLARVSGIFWPTAYFRIVQKIERRLNNCWVGVICTGVAALLLWFTVLNGRGLLKILITLVAVGLIVKGFLYCLAPAFRRNLSNTLLYQYLLLFRILCAAGVVFGCLLIYASVISGK